MIEQKKPKCPDCGNERLIGVEYYYTSPERYDGVSEWMCGECKTRIGRWSGLILKKGEIEARFGTRSPVLLKGEKNSTQKKK